jgi:hypothetical protein
MLNEGQLDQILTGVALGMPLEHMFVLSELSPEDMEAFRKNELYMAKANASAKKLTYDLLNDLRAVIEIQKDKGKDHAITWLLEKTDTHFSKNADGGDKPGIVNIFTKEVALKESDTVAIQVYDKPAEDTDTDTVKSPVNIDVKEDLQ